jgi:hypothetical protein
MGSWKGDKGNKGENIQIYRFGMGGQIGGGQNGIGIGQFVARNGRR